MHNSIRDNMWIVEIILGAFCISGLGVLLYYKNKGYFDDNKKQENSEQETQFLLNKSRRQRINDISKSNDIEMGIRNDYCSKDLSDIPSDNFSDIKSDGVESIKEDKSEDISININKCSSNPSYEEKSTIKKEFDWLVI